VPNSTVRYFTENSYTPNKNVTKSYRSPPDIYNVKKKPLHDIPYDWPTKTDCIIQRTDWQLRIIYSNTVFMILTQLWSANADIIIDTLQKLMWFQFILYIWIEKTNNQQNTKSHLPATRDGIISFSTYSAVNCKAPGVLLTLNTVIGLRKRLVVRSSRFNGRSLFLNHWSPLLSSTFTTHPTWQIRKYYRRKNFVHL